MLATISLEYSRWVDCLPSIIYSGLMGPPACEPRVAIITPCAMRPFLNLEMRAAEPIFTGARWSLVRSLPEGNAWRSPGGSKEVLFVPGDHERRHVLRLCFADDSCAFAGAMRSRGERT